MNFNLNGSTGGEARLAKILTGRTITVRVRFADLRAVTRSLTLSPQFRNEG